MPRRSRSTSAWLLIGTVLLGACSGGGSSENPSTTVARESEPTAPSRSTDGILRLGVLLPPEPVLQSPEHDDLRSVLESSVRVINASGPPWIMPVEVIFSDESTDVEESRRKVNALLDDGIDALIGPVSSDVAGAVARDVTAAGVGICSPASTSILMAKVPTDGLLIRTSPADDDIAVAMAQEIDRRGYSTAAIFYPDNVYGTAFLDHLTRTMVEAGLNLDPDGVLDTSLLFPYLPSPEGIAQALAQVPDLAPSMVLVIGDRTVADGVLGSFAAKNVIVNDGFANVSVTPTEAERYLRTSAAFDGFAIDTFDGVDQTVASLLELDPELRLQTPGQLPLLANYVDCLNVLALSSVLAESDVASDFMGQAAAATNSGSTCRTFVECIRIVSRGLNFDYDGWGKALDLDEGGQVIDGPLVVYGLDPTGTMSFRQMYGS